MLYMKAIFKKIAVPLSTMDNVHVLESQAQMLRVRLDGTEKESTGAWHVPEEHQKVVRAIVEVRLSEESSSRRQDGQDVQDLRDAIVKLEAAQAAAMTPELLPRLKAAVAALEMDRAGEIDPGLASPEWRSRFQRI